MTRTYATYKRPTSGQKPYTDWNWRAGNKFSKHTDRKIKCMGSNTHITQNRYQKKCRKERPRRSLHNTQRKNPPRRHKHCKYICTQHRSTQIHKKILEDLKKDINSNTIILRDFNTPLSKMDRSSKQNINKDIVSLNNTLEEMDLTDIYRELFIPKKQNTHSFQVYMENFQR